MKKSSKLFFIIVILLVGICVGCVTILVKDVLTPNTDNKANNKVNDNKEDKSKDEGGKVSLEPIDLTKYVVDAEFKYDKAIDKSYQLGEQEEAKIFSMDFIKMPHLKIESEDAKSFNDEMKKMFDEIGEKFMQELSKQKAENGTIVEYTSYLNGEVLSIIVNIFNTTSEGEKDEFYMYNIDIKTKKKVSYKDVYKKAGLDEKKAEEKIFDAIKKCSLLAGLTDDDCSEGETIQRFYDKSLESYKKDIQEGNIQCVLSQQFETCQSYSCLFLSLQL